MEKDFSQKKTRPPAVANMFYPGDIEELRYEVRGYLNRSKCKKNISTNRLFRNLPGFRQLFPDGRECLRNISKNY